MTLAKQSPPLPLPDEAALWTSARTGHDAARQRLIESYLPFARMIAAQVYAGRRDHDLEFDEYMQFGTIGLIEATDRFDPTQGVLFKTFASHRIKGAILSGIENLSEKRVQVSTRQRLMVERRDSARANLNPSTDDLFQQLADMAIGLALGYLLDNPVVYQHDEGIVPENQYTGIEMQQLRSRMESLVTGLPQRERMVIKYHYMNQLPFTQIADTMGLTKGRVSQLHRSGLEMLRVALKGVKACDVAW